MLYWSLDALLDFYDPQARSLSSLSSPSYPKCRFGHHFEKDGCGIWEISLGGLKTFSNTDSEGEIEICLENVEKCVGDMMETVHDARVVFASGYMAGVENGLESEGLDIKPVGLESELRR